MKVSRYLIILQISFFTLLNVKKSNSQDLDTNGASSLESSYFFYQQSELRRDCAEVTKRCSGSPSGVYSIKPDGLDAPFDVYCDLDTEDEGWTVFQRRHTGHIDFNRTWEEFKEGFGFLSGEFWLGNDKVAYMTNQKSYQLRIDVRLSNGASVSVTYDMFRLGDEWSGYKLLRIGKYNGTADFQRCPVNKVMKNCSCQASCAQPDVCEVECTEEETCVCPEGFLLNGTDCVAMDECGCFEQGVGVVPEGASASNPDCSKRCSCDANQLTCDDSYRCDSNALCEERNNTRGCYCRPGYRGDGVTCTPETFSDCYDVYISGSVNDGVYTIQPSGSATAFQVYCDMSNGGGWTVFQRRQDGSVDFYRNWATYKAGFGTPATEHWLGNENLYHLTNQKDYKMRVEFVDNDGGSYNMNYDSFSINNEADDYRLQTLGRFSGNTGYDYMAYHRGMAFSTHDDDNDHCGHYGCGVRYNCAEYYRGGWWYNDCYHANLNGDYDSTSYSGVALYNGDTNSTTYSLRYTEMKIRPV